MSDFLAHMTVVVQQQKVNASYNYKRMKYRCSVIVFFYYKRIRFFNFYYE